MSDFRGWNVGGLLHSQASYHWGLWGFPPHPWIPHPLASLPSVFSGNLEAPNRNLSHSPFSAHSLLPCPALRTQSLSTQATALSICAFTCSSYSPCETPEPGPTCESRIAEPDSVRTLGWPEGASPVEWDA